MNGDSLYWFMTNHTPLHICGLQIYRWLHLHLCMLTSWRWCSVRVRRGSVRVRRGSVRVRRGSVRVRRGSVRVWRGSVNNASDCYTAVPCSIPLPGTPLPEKNFFWKPSADDLLSTGRKMRMNLVKYCTVPPAKHYSLQTLRQLDINTDQ
jgi:hypothetical protein